MRIGIYGVPIETVKHDLPIQFPQIYSPTITDELRKEIISVAKSIDIQIEDLGELILGNKLDSRLIPTPFQFVDEETLKQMQLVDFQKLREEKQRIGNISKDYDLLIGIGSSHFGAITMYSSNEKIARYDYHGDYYMGPMNFRLQNNEYNHANYLIWVRDNLKRCKIGNYFAMSGEYLGNLLEPEDEFGASCTFHDIDLDCFGHTFQNIYETSNTTFSTEYCMNRLLELLKHSKPKKLGFFEYRLNNDPSRQGVNYIVSCIASCIGQDISKIWHNAIMA